MSSKVPSSFANVSDVTLTFASLYLPDMLVLINLYITKSLHGISPILQFFWHSPLYSSKLLQTIQRHTFLFSSKHLKTANSSAYRSLLYFSLDTSAGSCQMRWSVLWYPHALVWTTVCKPLFVHPRKVWLAIKTSAFRRVTERLQFVISLTLQPALSCCFEKSLVFFFPLY